MRLYYIYLIIVTTLTGCCVLNNDVAEVRYLNNELVDSLGPMNDYCIFDFMSPMMYTRDHEECHFAHYQVLLPSKKMMKKRFGSTENRCFLYSKGRGIAIFQDIGKSNRRYSNGLQQISGEMVRCLVDGQFYYQPRFFWGKWRNNDFKVKTFEINERKNHYLYVDEEIRIVFFNISDVDYDSFVGLPINSLKIKQRSYVVYKNSTK